MLGWIFDGIKELQKLYTAQHNMGSYKQTILYEKLVFEHYSGMESLCNSATACALKTFILQIC